MTTITIERELLEQALNALSAPNHCVFSEPPICVDIRAALLAPATAPDELERLRKDAERYRYLRAQRIDGEPGIPVIAVPNGIRSGYYMNEENADYAVDTAMKGTP